MNEIEDIIKKVAKNNVEIPAKIEHRVNYTLKNKNTKSRVHYIKRLVTSIVYILCTMIGSLTVYAAFGGTINNKPVIEWFGLNFSNNYDEYKEEVVDQQISYNSTTVDLISTLSDEGFSIFEFDVKLSDEDREYLRAGEKVITEKDWEDAKEQYETGRGTNAKSMGIPFEGTSNYKMLEKNKDTVNTIELEFNNSAENHKIHNIFIDDVGYYAKCIQTTNKVADNEYKVYQLYLLTDEILKGKNEFNVTLKGITLKNRADYKNEENETIYLANTANNAKSIDISGEIHTQISKEKIANNSKSIENNNEEIKYKKMTEKIEKITVTPVQTVIKISKVYNDISLQDISSTIDKDYIGIERYTVKDSDGNEIPSVNCETKRTVTYSNGKQEEWATGDIGTYKDFSDAKMETIEYLIIQHQESISNLKIISEVENIKTDEYGKSWDKIGEYNISMTE